MPMTVMDKVNQSSSSMPPPTHPNQSSSSMLLPAHPNQSLSSMLPPTHLTHPTSLAIQPNSGRTTNSPESSNGGSSDGPWVIVVEDSDEEGSDKGEVTDENDNAELGT